jgi:putative transposase
MSTFTLTIGLVIREELRTWRLDRMTDDGRLVFFDLESGAPKTTTAAQLQRDLEAGRLQVVQEHPVALSQDDIVGTRLVQTFEHLPEHEQLGLKLRVGYVKYMKRCGLGKGMRPRIATALDRLKGRPPGEVPPEVAVAVKKTPSASSVMSWMRKFDESGGNPLALLSGNCFRKSPRRMHKLVEDIARRKIRDFYCTRKRPSARQTKLLIDRELEQQVARGRLEADESKISPSTVRRLITDISPYDRCVARYGPSYARNRWRYSLGGIDARRVLARYEIDHTILDLVVVNDVTGLPMGRPTITVVVDSFSGYIAGAHISFWGAGLANALAAFKIAIRPKDFLTEHAGLTNKWLAYGIPDLMVVDNGLEFHSPHFHLAAMHLATDVLHCAVRQPWLKPMVERSIGEINGYLPTAGRVEKQLTNYLPENPDKTACITFGALCMGLLKAIVDVHPFEVTHRRLDRAYDLYSEGLAGQLAPRLPASTSELDIIMASSKTLTVGNEGVVKSYLRYNSPELQDMRRRIGLRFTTQVKFNPEDLGHVWVQDPQQKGWMHVPSCLPEYTAGLSDVQHRAIRVQKKSILTLRNAEEVLTQSKLELTDMWSSAMRRGKRLKGAQLRAVSGFTSNEVFSGSGKPAAPVSAPVVVPISKEELLPIPKEYETYEFN